MPNLPEHLEKIVDVMVAGEDFHVSVDWTVLRVVYHDIPTKDRTLIAEAVSRRIASLPQRVRELEGKTSLLDELVEAIRHERDEDAVEGHRMFNRAIDEIRKEYGIE